MVTTSVDVIIPLDQAVDNPDSVAAINKFNQQFQEPTIGTALSGGFDRNAALNTLNQAEKTLGEIQAGVDRLNQPVDFAVGDFYGGPSYSDLYGDDIDEDRVRRDTLRTFQREIDATEEVYNQMLREAQLEGQGRLGSQRAIAARGGILGSDFAGAQKEKVRDYNRDIISSINSEKLARIAYIEGRGRQLAQQEIAAKRAARQQGAENYIDFLAGREARKSNYIASVAQSLLEQDLTPEEVEDQLNNIATEVGTTPDAIKQQYYSLVAQQESAPGTEYKFFSGSGGLYRTNPQTGEVEFVPGGGGSSSSSRSSVRFTATQRNKLEQAGLSDAPRAEQLNYLFGDDESGGFDEARSIISDNPQLTDAEIKANLLENTDLSVTEINTLLETRTNREIPDFTNKVGQLAEKIFDNFDSIEDARSYVNTGKVTSNGKQYQLTEEQKEALLSALEEQRSFWQKIVPGGK